MSGKKTKADLVALFKLEFYRKQDNWKLCTHVQKKNPSVEKTKFRKTKPDVKSKNKEKCMNKTYHVATGDREKSVLNQAFVETEHDNNSPSTSNSPHSEQDASPLSITRDTKNSQVDQKFSNHDPNLTGNIERDEAFQKCAKEGVEIKATTLIEDWVQQNVTQYKGLVYNLQNCRTAEQNRADNIGKYPQSKFQILRHLADICNATEIKEQEFNNNLEDFEKKSGKVPEACCRYFLPEPILEKWDEWKETHISMGTSHTAPQSFSEVDLQSEMMWQDLPEIDKKGCEGPDAGWPFETQVLSNQRLFPDGISSDSVFRELRLLNVEELKPEAAAQAPAAKWVRPDRLLLWMLVNKECCEDVLESSCESEETFMRGVHCAPHSTEVDIQPQIDDLEGAEERAGEAVALSPRAMSPRALSPRALHAAAQAHERALVCLAREIAGRERLQNDMLSHPLQPVATGPPYDVICEEYPTRDVGLQQAAFTDTFIAGSYKNNPNNKQLEKQTDDQCNRKESEDLIYLKDGRIVLRDSKSCDQMKSIRGHRKLSEPQMDIDWGQYDMERDPTLDKPDQSSLDKAQKELEAGPYQMIQGIGQINQERGQTVQEGGQMVQERGPIFQERDLINREKGQMVFDRGVPSLDRCQSLEEPPMRSTKSDGRGRGRLHL